jgi:hypothetical protein
MLPLPPPPQKKKLRDIECRMLNRRIKINPDCSKMGKDYPGRHMSCLKFGLLFPAEYICKETYMFFLNSSLLLESGVENSKPALYA